MCRARVHRAAFGGFGYDGHATMVKRPRCHRHSKRQGFVGGVDCTRIQLVEEKRREEALPDSDFPVLPLFTCVSWFQHSPLLQHTVWG